MVLSLSILCRASDVFLLRSPASTNATCAIYSGVFLKAVLQKGYQLNWDIFQLWKSGRHPSFALQGDTELHAGLTVQTSLSKRSSWESIPWNST